MGRGNDNVMSGANQRLCFFKGKSQHFCCWKESNDIFVVAHIIANFVSRKSTFWQSKTDGPADFGGAEKK